MWGSPVAPGGALLPETTRSQYGVLSSPSAAVGSPDWTFSPACAHGVTAGGTPLALQPCGGWLPGRGPLAQRQRVAGVGDLRSGRPAAPADTHRLAGCCSRPRSAMSSYLTKNGPPWAARSTCRPAQADRILQVAEAKGLPECWGRKGHTQHQKAY